MTLYHRQAQAIGRTIELDNYGTKPPLLININEVFVFSAKKFTCLLFNVLKFASLFYE